MILEIYDNLTKEINAIEIKDIKKYSINCIIQYLSYKYYKYLSSFDTTEQNNIDITNFYVNKTIIHEYLLEKYLKFDSIKEIFIYKHWNIILNHLIRILKSPIINSAFNKLCEKIKVINCYNFLNDDDLKKLFENSAIFDFKCNFVGLTEPCFFFNYVYYRGKIDSYTDDCSKLVNLCSYQVTQKHEILGHINVRIQNYLSNKEISSPYLDYKDNDSNKTITAQESGDYMELILYGQRIYKLNINQLLFILDEDNYSLSDLEQFKNKFNSCKNEKYKISNTLSKFLNELNIKITDDLWDLEEIIINKDLISKSSINENYFYFNNKRHTHLHPPPPPPEISESTKKFIDVLFEEYYGEYQKKI